MAKRHAKAETDLRKTSGTDSRHERMKARPEADDLTDPDEVWEDSETTPSRDRKGTPGGERVADAGDVGGGQPQPYGTETQADAVARQTKRSGERRGVEKPKRG